MQTWRSQSIFKHEQTDGTENWFLYFFAWLFKIPCKSRVDTPSTPSTRYQCGLLRWHQGKHKDDNADVRWAYGDERYD